METHRDTIGREGLPELDRSWFLGWQDQLVKSAKKNLRKEGRIFPLLFMLTLADLVSKKAERLLVDLNKLKPLPLPSDKYVIAILPQELNLSQETEALRLLLRPEGRSRLDALLQMNVGGLTPEQMQRRLLDIAGRDFGISGPDLRAAYLRHQLKEVGALAYVKIDDGYTLNPKTKNRAEYPDTLVDCADAFESIIVSMETPTFMRIVTAPYVRAVRNTGRVEAFLPHQELLAPRVSDGSVGSAGIAGRYTWMMEAPV